MIAMIAKQGVQLALSSVYELLDATSDPTTAERVTEFIEASEPSIKKVNRIRNYRSGGYSLLDVSVQVSGSTTVSETAKLEADLTAKLMGWLAGGVTEIVLSFTPS